MEIQGSVGNIRGSPAVVVDYRHLMARLQQIQPDHLFWPVGIHHHQQGVGVRHQNGILNRQKRVLILRQTPQTLGHIAAGVGAGLLNNMHWRAFFSGNGTDTRRRAYAVHVGIAVPHDQHLRGRGRQLPQGVGHDPALDLGTLLQLLGTSTVELKVDLVFNNRLVAAPGQGHLHRQRGVLKQLIQSLRVPANADGQRGRNAVGTQDSMDRVQHGELPLLELG